MAIIVSEGGTYTPHPEGQFRAVCVDVVEQHNVPTEFGPKNKVRLVFQTEELLADGRPALASASFNASLNEKSRLRPFLEAWRGRKFTPAELKAFDLEALLGAGAVLQIQHTEKGGKVYDNITSVMRLMKGMEPVEPKGYTRRKDRPQDGSAPATGSGGNGHPTPPDFDDEPPTFDADSDDLPF